MKEKKRENYAIHCVLQLWYCCLCTELVVKTADDCLMLGAIMSHLSEMLISG